MADASMMALQKMYVSFGISRLMLLFSKGVKATSRACQYRQKMREKNMCLPWLTVKMDFSGLRRKATQIMIVQIDIEEPVIQNMNRGMNICFDGDFANSQAFYSTKLILGMHKYVDQKVSYILHDLNLR